MLGMPWSYLFRCSTDTLSGLEDQRLVHIFAGTGRCVPEFYSPFLGDEVHVGGLDGSTAQLLCHNVFQACKICGLFMRRIWCSYNQYDLLGRAPV
jgi:hypothetical protein